MAILSKNQATGLQSSVSVKQLQPNPLGVAGHTN